MQCSKSATNGWRCKREAAAPAILCAECKALVDAHRHRRREREKLERDAFMARHATRTPPKIAPPESDRTPPYEMRRYGLTTLLRPSVRAKYVEAFCHACNQNYDCSRDRIRQGTAARFGCGCAGNDLHLKRIGTSLPRELVPVRGAR